MQSTHQHFKRKLLRLIIFAVVIIGILVIVLLFLQKTVEKHYTTEMEASTIAIELYKSPDEEHKFMEKGSNLSSIHETMIPNDLIQ
jgi:sensor histidine kinase regulating citrate/malate metabolism